MVMIYLRRLLAAHVTALYSAVRIYTCFSRSCFETSPVDSTRIQEVEKRSQRFANAAGSESEPAGSSSNSLLSVTADVASRKWHRAAQVELEGKEATLQCTAHLEGGAAVAEAAACSQLHSVQKDTKGSPQA